MSGDLVTYTPPTPAEWQQTMELVKAVASTEFVPRNMRGEPGAVLASILTGRELGIGPMQSLKHIGIIEGKPGLSAELMAGLVRRRGHKLRIITRASDEAEVEGVRADDPQHPLRVCWTLRDAERAGLCRIDEGGRPIARSQQGKPMPWEKYPDALLLARAISALCRAMFSDVTAGFGYTPEEISSADGQTEATWGEPIADPVTGEVLDDSGRADSDPTPARAAGPTPQQMRQAQREATQTRQRAYHTIPTLDQIKRVRRPEDASKLIRAAGEEFGELIERAVVEMHRPAAPRDWWTGSSVSQRRDVLEYALELHEQQQHETSVAGVTPPASAADLASTGPVLEGEAEAGPVDSPVTESGRDGD